MQLRERIKSLAIEFLPKVIALRRQLHANPELSWQEHQTAQLVETTLQELGIATTRMAGTGVVGILQTNQPEQRIIGLRADMDALPIQEKNEVEYCSKQPGVMHACGHDVHTANLLGAAMILSALKNELTGTYKFIFQPSEEKIPSGALAMIEAGVLHNPAPAVLLGLHVSPELEQGTIGYCPGPFMASSDEIYITVKGKGGHAARPQDVNNPLYIAAALLLELKDLTVAHENTILNFGKIEGLGATNIVPDTVEIAGTLRCFDEEKRSQIHEQINSVSQSIAQKNAAVCTVNIQPFAPVLINDVALTEKAGAIAESLLGNQNVLHVPMRTGSEDFAHYTHHLPCCFLRLGTGNEALGIKAGLHTPNFDVDEHALYTGMYTLSCIAAEL